MVDARRFHRSADRAWPWFGCTVDQLDTGWWWRRIDYWLPDRLPEYRGCIPCAGNSWGSCGSALILPELACRERGDPASERPAEHVPDLLWGHGHERPDHFPAALAGKRFHGSTRQFWCRRRGYLRCPPCRRAGAKWLYFGRSAGNDLGAGAEPCPDHRFLRDVPCDFSAVPVSADRHSRAQGLSDGILLPRILGTDLRGAPHVHHPVFGIAA